VLASTTESVVMLRPGLWHGDEVPAIKIGGMWWGLFGEAEAFELREVAVSATKANDPIVDAENEATGIQISVTGDAEPFLLLRGDASFREGKIASVFSGRRFIFPGEAVDLGGDDNVPYVHVAAFGRADERDGQPAMTHYSLKLSTNTTDEQRSQTIVARDTIDVDAGPWLLWAGDLDRDGRADFLFDLTDHYNVSHLALFLSTSAKEGEVAGLAGEWRTTGC
jgi:hypothetical protein